MPCRTQVQHQGHQDQEPLHPPLDQALLLPRPPYRLCVLRHQIPLRVSGGVEHDPEDKFDKYFNIPQKPEVLLPTTPTLWKNFQLPYPDFIGSHVYHYEMFEVNPIQKITTELQGCPKFKPNNEKKHNKLDCTTDDQDAEYYTLDNIYYTLPENAENIEVMAFLPLDKQTAGFQPIRYYCAGINLKNKTDGYPDFKKGSDLNKVLLKPYDGRKERIGEFQHGFSYQEQGKRGEIFARRHGEKRHIY